MFSESYFYNKRVLANSLTECSERMNAHENKHLMNDAKKLKRIINNLF